MSHSRSSSISDLHTYSQPSASYSYGPPSSDTASEPPSRRASLAYDPYAPPALPGSGSGSGGGEGGAGSVASAGTSTAAAAGGSRRSRARAFSFLLDSSSTPVHGRRASLSSTLGDHHSDLPFGGDAYDFALRAEEEEEEDLEPELGAAAGGGGGGGAEAQQRRAYRQTFQPIVQEELWWMGVSAAAVLGLTVGAVVLSVVG